MMDDGRETRAVISRSIFADDDEDWKTSTGDGSVTFSRNASEIRFDDYEEIRGDDPQKDPFRSNASGLPKLTHNGGRSDSDKGWSSWWNSSSQDRPGSSTSSISLSEKKSLHDLQAEVRTLQRKLEEARASRWNRLSVRDTIKRMMLKKPYSLEPYRSFEDKVDLLQTAIQYHDGNCIMAVLMFLKQTLRFGKFFDLIVKFPEAEQHYIAYLKQHYAWFELRKLYRDLARYEDEWVLLYNQNRNITPADTRVRRLESCLKFEMPGSDGFAKSHYAAVVKEQIDLLSRQIPLEEKDAKAESLGEYALFKAHPRSSKVLYTSLITTLYYCCFYHYEAKPEALRSPIKFRTDFKLSEKQYLWTALAARARLKRWGDFEQLLTTKGWFGSTKLKSKISFDKIVELLHKQKASPDQLEKYARLVDDLSLRFKVVARIGRHVLAVQTLVELRDRDQLLQYQDKVPPTDRRTHDLIYRSLNDVSIKWR